MDSIHVISNINTCWDKNYWNIFIWNYINRIKYVYIWISYFVLDLYFVEKHPVVSQCEQKQTLNQDSPDNMTCK